MDTWSQLQKNEQTMQAPRPEDLEKFILCVSNLPPTTSGDALFARFRAATRGYVTHAEAFSRICRTQGGRYVKVSLMTAETAEASLHVDLKIAGRVVEVEPYPFSDRIVIVHRIPRSAQSQAIFEALEQHYDDELDLLSICTGRAFYEERYGHVTVTGKEARDDSLALDGTYWGEYEIGVELCE